MYGKEVVNMLIIAHRCGTGKYPELTMEAARHSLMLGADYVEMDVQYTVDDVPVICHDANALRVFGKDMDISQMTITEFLALRHVTDKSFCSHALDHFLAAGIAPILLHCKIGGKYIEDILLHLRRFDYEDKAIMGVQSVDDVVRTKNFNSSNIPVLAFMRTQDEYKDFIESGADIIRLWESWVSIQSIEEIHNSGKKVWVMANLPSKGGVGYTSEENLRSWLNMQVDGVLIDDVEWAMQVLRDMG